MPADTTSYEEYMQMSMMMLSMCSNIYMLKGWEKSTGANREFGYALARDMIISSNLQTLVVGFLCNSNEAKNFEDGSWVSITGEITKGKYHNSEIPIIKVTEIKKVDMPENIFVLPPNKTYIPTSGIL